MSGLLSTRAGLSKGERKRRPFREALVLLLRRVGCGGNRGLTAPRPSHIGHLSPEAPIWCWFWRDRPSLSMPAGHTCACLAQRGATAPRLSLFLSWKQCKVPGDSRFLWDLPLVLSCLTFHSISGIHILLHLYICQHACLSIVTSCRPTEQKGWKKPWKTLPSKHLRFRHASPLGNWAVPRQNQVRLGRGKGCTCSF